MNLTGSSASSELLLPTIHHHWITQKQPIDYLKHLDITFAFPPDWERAIERVPDDWIKTYKHIQLCNLHSDVVYDTGYTSVRNFFYMHLQRRERGDYTTPYFLPFKVTMTDDAVFFHIRLCNSQKCVVSDDSFIPLWTETQKNDPKICWGSRSR